ncbi:MAG: hypothetical protein V7K35_23775 [Nostoc sp.]|uniref:hypothetical protein n=1 Tax=Nostoc sp. TaxID=1180 RepID=UPI002FFC237C
MVTSLKTKTLEKVDVAQTSVKLLNLDKVLEKFICTEIVAKDTRDTDTGTSGDDRQKDD